jgi:hypothetical protein
MAEKSKQARGLANPDTLAPFDKDKSAIVVIIETPKGSRNKYAFDVKERIFALKKVLPAGMSFPYDFGFIPATIGGDGDPPLGRPGIDGRTRFRRLQVKLPRHWDHRRRAGKQEEERAKRSDRGYRG